jgi:uncharacterized protein YfaQ (DUF2300 family)
MEDRIMTVRLTTPKKTPALLGSIALLCMCFMLPTAAPAAQFLCCPDEWQGGGACPPGQRIASYCDNNCQSCGQFFCYTQPSGPGQQCAT